MKYWFTSCINDEFMNILKYQYWHENENYITLKYQYWPNNKNSNTLIAPTSQIYKFN